MSFPELMLYLTKQYIGVYGYSMFPGFSHKQGLVLGLKDKFLALAL